MAEAPITQAGPEAVKADFRKVMAAYPTGVTIITSSDPGHEEGPLHGMVMGSFASVSLDPPLVMFMPQASSRTWPLVEATGRFCVNMLSASQQSLCQRFFAKVADPFQGINWSVSVRGLPRIGGCLGWIDCTIHEVVPAGDHLIVLGLATDLVVSGRQKPLLFHQGRYGSFTDLTGTPLPARAGIFPLPEND